MGELGGVLLARAHIDEQDRLVVHMYAKDKEEGVVVPGALKLRTMRTREEGKNRNNYFDFLKAN